ncbi:gas vesicle structural protein GvpA [Actinocrinis puniceicyclus]|uniref:Gas vesicle protein A n=1 Tax=Actinocrinis puniceicyclus TaxID=977794 RepID=A0A8J7WM51_9ACTN|nr:gas vesicle protein GvpJ [Actinocrinis puniceicyclus]MBS2964933.1 gas vesicle structural protein GvpA [Actinocrinis puniceicyclus]
MTVQPSGGGGALNRPDASGLADVIDTILDKGLVIDAYVRVALVGIELLTIDARVVIASVDTYLRFAEAVNRLDLTENQQKGLPDLVGDINQGAAKSRTKGALDAAGEKLGNLLDAAPEREDARRERRRTQ